MIWFLLVFVLMVVAGLFHAPIWLQTGALVVIFIFYLIRNPLYLGKDPEKFKELLKKSNRPNLKFLYHFLNDQFLTAEKEIEKIRSVKLKRNAELMLFMERKQYSEAKELLNQMPENNNKWYSLADIALNEGDVESFKQNKEKIKDAFLLNILEVDQAIYEGKRGEAVAMLDIMIPKLSGYKLLTTDHYRKQILDGKKF